MTITLDTYNIHTAERVLIEKALADSGSIHGAAELLGITRHAVKRRIIKHGIRWVRGAPACDASLRAQALALLSTPAAATASDIDTHRALARLLDARPTVVGGN